MAKKKCNKIRERQKQIEEIKATAKKLQEMGMLGESKIVDGDIAWRIGPEHAAKVQVFAQVILGHPERWNEVPAFRGRETELYALRNEAIRASFIRP